ncbi:hypothetical protein HYQ46_010373 [Verticillium longisporum]|nr:hypothetical protein HYQ46_010373 [Verticillium longisporum]
MQTQSPRKRPGRISKPPKSRDVQSERVHGQRAETTILDNLSNLICGKLGCIVSNDGTFSQQAYVKLEDTVGVCEATLDCGRARSAGHALYGDRRCGDGTRRAGTGF